MSVGHFFLYVSPFLSSVLPLVCVDPIEVGVEAIVLLLIMFC